MLRGDPGASDGVIPHVWVGGYSPGGIPADEFADNVLSFCDRHDLTVVLSQWTTTEADARSLEERVKLAREWDVDVWLGTYDLREHTDVELVSDETAMDEDLERLHRIVDVYAEHYPDGKVFVWHEPPNTGQWTGETRAERARSMVDHGPEIFSRQKQSVAERHPELDFGLMLWWPTAAPPGLTATPICEPLMNRLADRGALPDFTYIDVYRYHFEWDVGHEAVNELIAATLENIKEHTNDRPVYFLADLHSYPEIGPHPSTYDTFPQGNKAYTPSKQALLGHIDAPFGVGVESVGWYLGKHYRTATHHRNYEPFLPNVGAVDDQRYFNSLTGSRDRFVWATLALREAADTITPEECFDLWLYGHDLDFYEHAVELRAANGQWEFLGDVSGYVNGDNPYSGGDRNRVVAFHALERERYLDGSLEVRLATQEDGDGATLHGAYAVPSLDAGHYLTEPELTELVEGDQAFERAVLAKSTPDAELSPGTETLVELAVSEPSVDLDRLVHPAQRETRADAADLEAEPEFDPRERFDLWLNGDGLGQPVVELNGTEISEYGIAADERGDDDGARVYRGLERSAYFERHSGGHYLDLSVTADAPATVRAVYVMPYHGTANFTPDAEAAAIVERDYAVGEGMLTTFALGHQIWPGGVDLDPDEQLSTWVQIPHRQARPESG